MMLDSGTPFRMSSEMASTAELPGFDLRIFRRNLDEQVV